MVYMVVYVKDGKKVREPFVGPWIDGRPACDVAQVRAGKLRRMGYAACVETTEE